MVTIMNKEIFDKEQSHLSETYDKLLKKKEEILSQIAALNEKAVADKNDMRDNIRFDYADIETTMETLTEIEVWNRYIDTYNVESSSLSKKLDTVNKLLDSPYFAKISLQFDPSEEPESYYIGRAAISEKGPNQLIVDWRSPIAEVYYNQEMGHTSYTVDDREIPVDLKLRRQFDLNRDKLISYFDTQIAIEDPMLIKSLSQTHTDKMQAITATIQKEQNTVIRYPDVPVLLVDGIAGSGKTSVLLQRIAYLFYQKRKTLRPDQVCLLTLNPVFREYIDNVLPDMGETNPVTLTWREFLEAANAPGSIMDFDDTDAETLECIKVCLPDLEPEADDFFDIRQKETIVLTKEDVLSVVRKYKKFPFGMRLIQIASDELEQRAKNNMRNMDDGTDESSESTASSETARENRIENDFGGALSTIRNCGFINITHIVQRILGVKKVTSAQWLYARMELTGRCDKNMRYVMVDEVQDYTRAQMMVFEKFYPNARFMLLGDEFQSIREGTVKFKEIEQMAEDAGKKFVMLPLMTSYRSSPEITDKFAALLPDKKKMQVSSVKRPGEKVYVKSCKSDKEYYAELKKLVENYGKKDGLTAVIVRDPSSLEEIVAALSEDAPQIVSGTDALPKEGAFMLELPYAKGLEFDHVILADADSRTYPDDELGRHCLYTAMSRATQHLAILCKGDLAANI
ncbi:MAG: DNA helicase [Butyrivibrio sp.]|nr:DNA helicase [Butyrivibrio sp.]